jgi:hypothetical protein
LKVAVLQVKRIKDHQQFKNKRPKRMLKIATFHISTDGTTSILRTMLKIKNMNRLMKDNNGQMM